MGTLAAVGQAAKAATDTNDEHLYAILAFGVVVLAIFSSIYFVRRNINVTFARLFGLAVVAVLGVALAFADLTDGARTAAFTLLGAIAGYLAGAKASTHVTEGGDDADGDSGTGAGAPSKSAGKRAGPRVQMRRETVL